MLPADLQRVVLSFIAPRDRFALRRVCRMWRDYIDKVSPVAVATLVSYRKFKKPKSKETQLIYCDNDIIVTKECIYDWNLNIKNSYKSICDVIKYSIGYVINSDEGIWLWEKEKDVYREIDKSIDSCIEKFSETQILIDNSGQIKIIDLVTGKQQICIQETYYSIKGCYLETRTETFSLLDNKQVARGRAQSSDGNFCYTGEAICYRPRNLFYFISLTGNIDLHTVNGYCLVLGNEKLYLFKVGERLTLEDETESHIDLFYGIDDRFNLSFGFNQVFINFEMGRIEKGEYCDTYAANFKHRAILVCGGYTRSGFTVSYF